MRIEARGKGGDRNALPLAERREATRQPKVSTAGLTSFGAVVFLKQESVKSFGEIFRHVHEGRTAAHQILR